MSWNHPSWQPVRRIAPIIGGGVSVDRMSQPSPLQGPSVAPTVTVMWRPGCPFCALLLRRLQRTGLVFDRIDIWQDPEAAAWVRQVADGNETVPTVRIAAGPGSDGPELALVNPSPRAVIEAVARLAPHALPSDGNGAGARHGASVAPALAQHWDAAHTTRAEDDVSWFQARPETSLRLVLAQLDALGIARPDARVLDAGAGRSRLVDHLLDEGVGHVTLVDISAQALEVVRARVGARADGARAASADGRVVTVVADVAGWSPPAGGVDVWHDRAALHFLVGEDDRRAYVAAVTQALAPGGRVVLASFAPDGPTSCSGLDVRRSDDTELAALFGADFTLVHTEREAHVTPKDVVQPFTWVVLARR